MIIEKKHLLYLPLIWLLLFSKQTFSQDLSLKCISNNKKEQKILEEIGYWKKHTTKDNIANECLKISNFLKKQGYFTNTIDSIVKKNSGYECYFSLRKKIRIVGLIYENNLKDLDTIFLPASKTEDYLEKITSNIDIKGASFSKTVLKNHRINTDTLFSYVETTLSVKRKINKVIVKGYTSFPTKFLKNHFKIKENETVFSKKKIKETSNGINSLSFVKSLKPPEVLFKKDSTLLYLFLEKKQNNSFDGLVNFTTRENGSILFNGMLDIQLNNIFNKGEFFALNWNTINGERQELKVSLEMPYIFNSRITPKLNFNIYKQDSIFINTRFSSLFDYSIGNRTNLGLSLLSESSETISTANQNKNQSYNSFFTGIHFAYHIPNDNNLLGDIFSFIINPLIGNRNTPKSSTSQFKLNTEISYLQKINTTNFIFLKNTTGILNSTTFLNNELFRVGGANSIRGFNEQSFFTSNYSYFNIEYRYLTSKTSYFFTITDIGRLYISSKKNDVIGLGLGYSFVNKNSTIKLSTALGKTTNNKFQFRNPKFIINWKIFF